MEKYLKLTLDQIEEIRNWSTDEWDAFLLGIEIMGEIEPDRGEKEPLLVKTSDSSTCWHIPNSSDPDYTNCGLLISGLHIGHIIKQRSTNWFDDFRHMGKRGCRNCAYTKGGNDLFLKVPKE